MADYQGKATGAEIDMLPDIIAKVFPLTASYATKNNGTYEVGTSVTPSVTLSITRKGADVSSSATITASGTTLGADKKSWTAPSLSSGSKSYSTKVSQGGQEVDLGSLTWSFTNYRYRGEVSAVPTNYATAIKALTTKELTTSASLGSTSLGANKYYLFAIKSSTATFVVKHAQTGGIITGCVTGKVTISQENDSSLTNEYSYVLVPASSSAWNFIIN